VATKFEPEPLVLLQELLPLEQPVPLLRAEREAAEVAAAVQPALQRPLALVPVGA
jgi:hypothetical protein